jgi:hypothetical protein
MAPRREKTLRGKMSAVTSGARVIVSSDRKRAEVEGGIVAEPPISVLLTVPRDSKGPN